MEMWCYGETISSKCDYIVTSVIYAPKGDPIIIDVGKFAGGNDLIYASLLVSVPAILFADHTELLFVADSRPIRAYCV